VTDYFQVGGALRAFLLELLINESIELVSWNDTIKIKDLRIGLTLGHCRLFNWKFWGHNLLAVERRTITPQPFSVNPPRSI
jgi:hypothetical protein